MFLESLTVDTCGVYDAGRLEAEDGFAADIAAAAALLKEEGALPARIAALRRAQPDTMSPIEAMQLLYDLKKKLPN